jgi:membrane protein
MNISALKQSLTERCRRAGRFLADEVWDVELSSLSSLGRLGVKIVRVLQLVVKGFQQDECPLHASALTFNTLMSIVPVLALSLALARGLGDEQTAKNRIRGVVSEWTAQFGEAGSVTNVVGDAESGPEGEPAADEPGDGEVLPPSALAAQIDSMVETGFEKIENISFTALGGVGLVILLWMVIQVLGRVEASFNRVWGITVGRSLWRRFADYLSMLFILPLLVIAASSVPVVDFATRFLDEATAEMVKVWLDSAPLRHLTVLSTSTLCFTFLIMFMPNTRVKLLPGLTGGLVVSLLFLLWLSICAALQVGAARYGKIYGSFAVVPIVLAWVYVSWQIVFFGAEVAFAVQNCGTYRMEQGARRASVQAKIILALSVIADAARAMVRRTPVFDVAACARERVVPVRLLNDIVDELVQAGLLGELSEKQGCYVLLQSPDNLNLREVVEAVMHSGVEPERLGLDTVDSGVKDVAVRASQGMNESLSGMTVRDLLSAPPSSERP